jgi:hypothetical protein
LRNAAAPDLPQLGCATKNWHRVQVPTTVLNALTKAGTPAGANFEYGARLTEIVLLGKVALRTGRKIEWDGPNMKARNAPEVERLIKEDYRPEWEIG